MNCAVSHSFRKTVSARVLLIVVLLLPGMVLGQSYRGSIRGKVSDPSGGLLAAAKITSKNVDTGLTRDGVTNEEGTYVLAELPAGTYTVTVNAPGFAPVAQNVVVSVGLDTTADFAMLKVEQHQESVTAVSYTHLRAHE